MAPLLSIVIAGPERPVKYPKIVVGNDPRTAIPHPGALVSNRSLFRNVEKGGMDFHEKACVRSVCDCFSIVFKIGTLMLTVESHANLARNPYLLAGEVRRVEG